MKYLYIYFIVLSIVVLWMAFEVWRAPLLDDKFNVIRKEKTFSDLLKKLKLWK